MQVRGHWGVQQSSSSQNSEPINDQICTLSHEPTHDDIEMSPNECYALVRNKK